MDRLSEIEEGFIGHPEDDYYFVEAADFKWLIAHAKNLEKFALAIRDMDGREIPPTTDVHVFLGILKLAAWNALDDKEFTF